LDVVDEVVDAWKRIEILHRKGRWAKTRSHEDGCRSSVGRLTRLAGGLL
jgi:hypothetical protein